MAACLVPGGTRFPCRQTKFRSGIEAETEMLRYGIGAKQLWRKKHRPEKFPAGLGNTPNQPHFGHARERFRLKINIAFTDYSRLNA
jgi:hypothetical protein